MILASQEFKRVSRVVTTKVSARGSISRTVARITTNLLDWPTMSVKVIAVQECRSLEGWHPIQIPSQSDPNRSYTVLANAFVPPHTWVCQCKGFSYRGKCNHQQLAVSEFCGWHETDGKFTQTEQERKEKICPACGGPSKWVMEFEEET